MKQKKICTRQVVNSLFFFQFWKFIFKWLVYFKAASRKEIDFSNAICAHNSVGLCLRPFLSSLLVWTLCRLFSFFFITSSFWLHFKKKIDKFKKAKINLGVLYLFKKNVFFFSRKRQKNELALHATKSEVIK